MPGLIETKLPSSNQSVYTPETEQMEPTLREVKPETETVAGQLHSLLSSGSPYLERAKAGAREAANSRGLLNTSMAAGAGEAAAIDAALPIAQSDAGIYNAASSANQGYQNTAGQFNAGAKNTANMQGAQAAQQLGAIGAAGEQDIKLQTLRGDQAERLANLEVISRQLGQTTVSATALYQGLQKAINDIMANSDIDPTNKNLAVQANIDMLESGLALLGGINDLDLGSLLDFSGTGATYSAQPWQPNQELTGTIQP